MHQMGINKSRQHPSFTHSLWITTYISTKIKHNISDVEELFRITKYIGNVEEFTYLLPQFRRHQKISVSRDWSDFSDGLGILDVFVSPGSIFINVKIGTFNVVPELRLLLPKFRQDDPVRLTWRQSPFK